MPMAQLKPSNAILRDFVIIRPQHTCGGDSPPGS